MTQHYSPLLPHLTPHDLAHAGFALRTHPCGGFCWWRPLAQGGESHGASWPTLAEAANDARWRADVALVTSAIERRMKLFEEDRV